jgi:hypothetical protein
MVLHSDDDSSNRTEYVSIRHSQTLPFFQFVVDIVFFIFRLIIFAQ